MTSLTLSTNKMASYTKSFNMVVLQNKSLWLLFIFQFLIIGTASWDDYTMADDFRHDCGKIITDSKGGRVKAYEDGAQDPFNCQLTFTAPDANKQFFLYFDKFILKAVQSDCSDHKLEIFDGDSVNASSLTGANGLCQLGDDTDLPDPIRTTGDSVTFVMTRNSATSRAQFRIIFSTFKSTTGNCYKCKDTDDLCIDSSLVCDGLDNCPSGSDEDHGEGGGCQDVGFIKVWIIVVGIVVGVIVLMLFLVCICCIWIICRRRTRPKANAATGYQTQGAQVQYSGQAGPESPPPQNPSAPPQENDPIVPQKK